MSNLLAAGVIVPDMETAMNDLTVHIPSLGEQLVNPKISLVHRFRALFTLKNIGGQEAINCIAKGFETNDASALLKHEFAYCLGQMQDERAAKVLIEVLSNPNEADVVRHEAGEAIAALGLAKHIPLMEKYSKDPVIDVAETCEVGLGRLKWLADPNRTEEWDMGGYNSHDPAPACTEKNVNVLETQLCDENLDLFQRYRAMFALRNIGTSEAVKALCRGFSGSSPLFRHEIGYVLGQLQHEDSVEALCNVLSDANEHPMVRHEAAEALGSIATDDCVPVLEKFLKDPCQIVRESCIVALDMYDYEQSDEFQYADGVSRVAEQQS